MKKLCFVTTVSSTMETFVKDLVIYLYEKGDFDITLICSPDEQFSNALPDYLHFVPIEMNRGFDLKGIISIFTITRFLKKNSIDYIQYSTPNAALYASIAATIANIPIRNYHLMGFRYLGASGLMRIALKKLEQLTCKLSTQIECVSRSNLELGIAEGIFDRNKVDVIWNGSSAGIDCSKFNLTRRTQLREKTRKELGYDTNNIVFCFAGRITHDKGINELFEAFSKTKNPDYRLLMLGSEEGVETLDQALLAKARNDNRIFFHPFVSDIVPFYAAIDILVLPSYREGFGNIIIEAEAMGVPVIVTNIPGPIDAMIPDVTGLTVRKKDSKELLFAMEKLGTDGELRIKMGAAGADFAQKSFDQKKLFEKVLQKRNSI